LEDASFLRLQDCDRSSSPVIESINRGGGLAEAIGPSDSGIRNLSALNKGAIEEKSQLVPNSKNFGVTFDYKKLSICFPTVPVFCFLFACS
jgi:hypothetical protein